MVREEVRNDLGSPPSALIILYLHLEERSWLVGVGGLGDIMMAVKSKGVRRGILECP